MYFELTASLMCANYGHLEKEIRELDEGGIDSFHIDIMDGRYVPNFAMSLNDMKYIASATRKPLDVHLMIEHPNNNTGTQCTFIRKRNTTPPPRFRRSSTRGWFRVSPSIRGRAWRQSMRCCASSGKCWS